MKRFLITLSLTAALGFAATAQQDAQYSMYMFNGLYINPAYAGSQDHGSLTGIFRRQWAGFAGGPTTASLSYHTPFKKDPNAVGAHFTFDKLGVTETFTLMGTYAYRIPIRKKYRLSLGIQAGFTQHVSDLSNIPLPDPGAADPEFMQDESLFHPNVGLGAYFFSDRFYVGASVPHLINYSLTENLTNAGTDDEARLVKHYLATVGYVFGKPLANVKFKPSILMKYVSHAPIDFDFNASILIVDRFWIGGSYRMGGDYQAGAGESIVGMFEFKATHQLRIGYAYDYTLSDFGEFNNGSHEIMAGFDFGVDRKRFVNPRYVKYF